MSFFKLNFYIKNPLSKLNMVKMKSYQYNAFYALLTLVLYNPIFFEKVWNVYPSVLFVSMMCVVLFALLNMACAILFWKHTTKPLSVIFCLINAAVLYFMDVYHVAFDKIMLMNVLETDKQEALALMNVDVLVSFFLFGILPSVILCKINILYNTPRREVLYKALVWLIGLVLCVAIIGAGYKQTAQFLRNNKPIKYSLLPVNYISAVISYSKMKIREKPHELIRIGQDAQIQPYWNNKKKNLFVLVVGETARAANFSLNGYERKTNQPLDKYQSELLSFKDVSSCGTSTAISLPCMFSVDGRDDFEKSTSSYKENLLDVAKRAGYKVWWRGNVTGCKGICSRVETEMLCKKDTCFDDILNKGLTQRLEQENSDMFVVLHQLGSHGPTYYKRYPKSAEIFSPNCKTERLDKCSREEIVNVYDNTIYYTSQNLADLIADLKKLETKYNVFLLYVSDHGESLGENNIYLHAAPYIIAPEEQTRVPMIMWFSNDFAKNFNLSRKCLQAKLKNEYSHDNLFHSLLGIMGVKTSDYNEKLDIFKNCIKK